MHNFFGGIILGAGCSLLCFLSSFFFFSSFLWWLREEVKKSLPLALLKWSSVVMFCRQKSEWKTLGARLELLLSHFILMSDFYTVGPQTALCLHFYL